MPCVFDYKFYHQCPMIFIHIHYLCYYVILQNIILWWSIQSTYSFVCKQPCATKVLKTMVLDLKFNDNNMVWIPHINSVFAKPQNYLKTFVVHEVLPTLAIQWRVFAYPSDKYDLQKWLDSTLTVFPFCCNVTLSSHYNNSM